MALLDTNVLVDMSQGRRTDAGRRAEAFLHRCLVAGQVLATSRINEAEFRVGAARARDRVAEGLKVEAVLSSLVIVEFDGAAAKQFANIKAHLFSIGRPNGDMDTLIAAIALCGGHTLVTRNVKHFHDVPGLSLDTY